MRNGLVAGSFDPITLGHLYVIQQALKASREVDIVVAVNGAKKSMFNTEERIQLIQDALYEVLGVFPEDVNVYALEEKGFIAKLAEGRSANIFRGIRNVTDFDYENAQQMINKGIAPEVSTLFVMPPANLTAVSSSMIKSMVGLEGWDKVAKQYVPKCVVKALKAKVKA